eukprot:scaffold77640_cov35-Prasinocladus_malaysianus.AAC.4
MSCCGDVILIFVTQWMSDDSGQTIGVTMRIYLEGHQISFDSVRHLQDAASELIEKIKIPFRQDNRCILPPSPKCSLTCMTTWNADNFFAVCVSALGLYCYTNDWLSIIERSRKFMVWRGATNLLAFLPIAANAFEEGSVISSNFFTETP